MISASHNLFENNGIKLFGPAGFKLSDEVERQIEQLMDENIESGWRRAPASAAPAVSTASTTATSNSPSAPATRLSLDGLRVVVDSATAQPTRWCPRRCGSWCRRRRHRRRAGRFNINRTAARPRRRRWRARCARCALNRHRARRRRRPRHHRRRARPLGGRRPASGGDRPELEGRRPARQAGPRRHRDVEPRPRALSCRPRHRVLRTPVGDRYVLERMLQDGYNLGGEPSGHIILSDFTTTGDGFVAALQVLAVVQKLGRRSRRCATASSRCRRSSRTCATVPASRSTIRGAGGDRDAEARLNGHGRLLVRSSAPSR